MENGIITGKDLVKFRKYLEDEEKSRATVEKYCRDVKKFLDYLGDLKCNREKVILYKKKLLEEGYEISSINSMIASLNSLFSFLCRNDCKIKSMKIQRRIYCQEKKELSRKEYLRLLKTAENRENERLNLILQTICGTGIRVSELPFITVENVRNMEAQVSCKGKTRIIFIVKKLQKKLLAFAKKNNIRTGPVFITRNGNPVNRTNVWRDMKKLCSEAGVAADKVFPHNLRHLFARSFYNLEKDIAKLADILGHSSINTTRIYMISTGAEHRRKLESMRLII